MFKENSDLEMISKKIGAYPEYVQGGGGNTSVKLDNEVMCIKASGYRLSDVTTNEAVAFVDYSRIVAYFAEYSEGTEEKFAEFMKEVTLQKDGYKNLRPSIEAGFHALLRKYVVHTHSVYSNILNCSVEVDKLVESIFGEAENTVVVEYASPGLALTQVINNTLKDFYEQYQRYPEIIFMKNHGVIVNADSAERVLELHEIVTELIKKYFNIQDTYPVIQIDEVKNGYVSRTNNKEIKQMHESFLVASENILFPDQIVYFNQEKGTDKITVNTDQGASILSYNTNKKEALTIEETLVAYTYIYDKILKNSLTISCLDDKQVDYVMNMESEKYRKQLIK